MVPALRLAPFIVTLLLAGPAQAGRERAAPTPGEMLDRVIVEAAEALRAVIDAVPRYAPPELRENGDIVIRRLPQPAVPPAPRQPAPFMSGEAT